MMYSVRGLLCFLLRRKPRVDNALDIRQGGERYMQAGHHASLGGAVSIYDEAGEGYRRYAVNHPALGDYVNADGMNRHGFGDLQFQIAKQNELLSQQTASQSLTQFQRAYRDGLLNQQNMPLLKPGVES